MRVVLGLGAALFLGAAAAACAYWAGASQGAPLAFVLAGLFVSIALPLGIGQLQNWGVPGDEPKLRWRHTE